MHTWKTILLASSCIAVVGEVPVTAQPSNTAGLQRLPAVETTADSDGLQLEGQDVVRFAADGVKFRSPEGWWVEEVPYQREVRLVLTPKQLDSRRRIPQDGIWITYHVATQPSEPPADELSRMLRKRLRLATANTGIFKQPTNFAMGPWPAISTEFTVDGSREQPPRPSFRGRHVLVRTDWGIVEFHASAPRELFDGRAQAWSTVWDSLRLEQPARSNEPPEPSVLAAEPILGSWKSYRGRMRLHGDGRISIIPDSVNLMTEPNSARALTGRFSAKDDLLFVTWDDGSRLNFRWRSRGSDLFLTDHEGHISQLKRLFE